MTFNSIRKAITNNDKIIRSNWVRYSFFLMCLLAFHHSSTKIYMWKKLSNQGKQPSPPINLKVPPSIERLLPTSQDIISFG